MNKPPLSFRLTEQEWEVLQQEQQSNESINQTAARLLRERLGILSVDDEYTLESTTLEKWINALLDAKAESMKCSLEIIVSEEVEKINQRLDLIETRLSKSRTRKLDSTKLKDEI